jgi:purine-nucleoside phosphorylase
MGRLSLPVFYAINTTQSFAGRVWPGLLLSMRDRPALSHNLHPREVSVMTDDIQEAANAVSEGLSLPPRIGMIMGTGLGVMTETMDVRFQIPYQDIPHFPASTVQGHKGRLVYGSLGGVPLIAMEGRFHLYEGYTPRQVTFPVRVMARLGVTHLLISSAAGGLNPRFEPEDMMVVTDHINLTGANPLIGPNLDAFGPRFPGMTQAYDPELIRTVRREALSEGVDLHQGVYVGVLGPSLETPAETRFLRMIGADAVGMSTVQEVIAGVHCGLRIAVIAAITNVNLPDCMEDLSIETVIDRAERCGVVIARIWERTVAALPL